jgi:hypothetical protein
VETVDRRVAAADRPPADHTNADEQRMKPLSQAFENRHTPVH